MDDELLHRLRALAADPATRGGGTFSATSTPLPVAAPAAVRAAETRLGFPLPAPLAVEMYEEDPDGAVFVANPFTKTKVRQSKLLLRRPS